MDIIADESLAPGQTIMITEHFQHSVVHRVDEDGAKTPLVEVYRVDESQLPADPAEAAVAALLDALGVDEGDHTADTPRRVAKAWREQLAGYAEDPSAHLLKTFSAPEHPGTVAVHGIRFASTCAHHLLPITGTATVAYLPRPGANVVGLSKLARVLEGYARRLQVQEQLGAQVADAIVDRLDPVAAAVLITAEHGCMTVRGVHQPGAATTTSSVRGQWPEGELASLASLHRAVSL